MYQKCIVGLHYFGDYSAEANKHYIFIIVAWNTCPGKAEQLEVQGGLFSGIV